MTLKVVTYFDIDQQKHWYLQWNSAPDIKANRKKNRKTEKPRKTKTVKPGHKTAKPGQIYLIDNLVDGW